MPTAAPGTARGIDPTWTPQGDVIVTPGQLTQALVDGRGIGTRFALLPGAHRLSAPLRLKDGQQLLGHPGASLNGSKVLSGFGASGGAWYVDGQTQRLPGASAPGYSICLADGPMCNEPEAVFLDGVPLKQVGSRAELQSGRFWFDKTVSRIWLGSDPSGRTVETTVATGAVVNGRNNVLRNLVVERFGNAPQAAAIHGVDMVIERSVVQHTSGQGISNYGGVIRGNLVLRNGQMGLAGGGSGLLVENNEIAFNNTERVNPEWEGGGTKWAFSTDLVVRDNWNHHNWGSGFTTDIDNLRSLYERNTVEDNGDIGIMHEISHSAVIRNNVVRRNGQRVGWFPGRVGINVTNSTGVQVHGNVVEDNAGGGILGAQDCRTGGGANGTWDLRDLKVYDNTVRGIGTGGHFQWQNGLDIHTCVADRGSYYTSRGNLYSNNRYVMPTSGGLWFISNQPDGSTTVSVGWTAWAATGQDQSSAMRTQ